MTGIMVNLSFQSKSRGTGRALEYGAVEQASKAIADLIVERRLFVAMRWQLFRTKGPAGRHRALAGTGELTRVGSGDVPVNRAED